ncbi:MAG: Wzz/FepE/Etk N-terminal domain-containing protein, partial [Candidatus Omnitrophica bacterium]|nr:Wzz/FepE/Etk N-terminal domain-containing protein [Candidatus Omnitrophota bacterium]
MQKSEYKKYHNPLDYLKMFFRRKWMFLGPAFFGLIGGIILALVLPPVYESSTTIKVEEEKIINPLIQELAVSTTAAQRMQSIKEVILSWNSLVGLTEELNLAEKVETQLGFERFIADLREQIVVEMPQYDIIRISYSNRDPQKAQEVAQKLTDILIATNLKSQTRETDVAIRFIKEQLGIYKRKIKESEIAQLEQQLKDLLVDSTERHPMVIELRQKLEIARSELDSDEFKVEGIDQPLPDNARTILKTELDRILSQDGGAFTSQVVGMDADADPNAAIYRLLLMDKIDAARARDMGINEEIYRMLLGRLETAKITQRLEASKEGTRYNILEPPRVPLEPTQPQKPRVIILGLVLGACVGAGLVFGREFMDNSFLDIED